MPLVRYEVRCEHSLANPELYRTAGQDDSEGLLEGVAMAGLVGLVRQLGDLAEFAAEIFHGLHDDIKALVSRSRNLKTRVARLEVDLPALEKALIAECSQFQFAYSARTKWRAPLPMDLNLCAQGELPLFVRNFYDDCRGPPRLFLLDKFDEAGRGACVKRYTDPTFFRISWAASLVSKAEQQRREREAELQRKTTAADDNAGPKIPPRERLSSALFENLEGFTGDFTPELLSRRMDHRSFDELLPPEGMLTPEDSRSPEEPRSPAAAPRSLPQVAQGPVLAPLKMSSKDHRGLPRGLPRGVVMDSSSVLMDSSPVLSEDESSSDDDAEFYVDALTTMGSDDPDSEPGSRTSRWEVDSNPSRFGLESEEEELMDRENLNNLVLKSLVEAHWKTPPRMEEDEEEVGRNEDFVRRLGLDEVGTGFDTVREWEDSRAQTEEGSVEESIELASVASVGEEDAQNCLAIVARSVFQEEPLLAELPDRSADKSPEKLLPDKPPDYQADSDTPSDKFPYSSADKPPDNLSDRLPAGLLLITLPERLPSSPPDSRPTPLIDSLPTPLIDSLPRSPPHSLPTPALDEVPDTFSDKLPYQTPDAQLHSGPPPSTLPTSPSDKGSDTVSAQVPNKLKPRDGKLPQASPQACSDKSSDKAPDKSSSKPRDGKLPSLPKRPHGRSDKLPDKLSAKSPSKPAAKSPSKPAAKPPPEKPTYQSHDSVSLLDSFRSSVRVKPIIASLEARAHTLASESTSKPENSSTSPVTPPKGRRLWTKENATQIHTSILQFADMDQRGDPSEENFPDLGDERHARHVSVTSDVEGYTSSASSTPKGLPNFWVLLSPSESPPRVAEGLMRPPSLFEGRYPHLPPVTPFLAGSPSVSRSPSLNAKSAGPGAISVPTQGTPGAAREADKLQNVPATSPKRVSENGVLQLDPSRNQSSTLPNPVPRPRTWVDRSASNVAATLRAIRQAATAASDDDTGSECWTDC